MDKAIKQAINELTGITDKKLCPRCNTYVFTVVETHMTNGDVFDLCEKCSAHLEAEAEMQAELEAERREEAREMQMEEDNHYREEELDAGGEE